MTQEQELIYRLRRSPLWNYACKIDLNWKANMEVKLTGVAFSRKLQRTFLIWAHTRIVSAISDGMPGTEIFQAVPIECLSSPHALSLIIERPEFAESARDGSMTVQDLIRVSRTTL